MRLIRSGALLGVALALVAGATAAHALWQRQATVTAASSRTADMAVTATWTPSAPSWAAMYPGESRTANLVVRQSGSTGTTLRWTLQAGARIDAPASSYASVQLWAGACGTGTLLYSPARGAVAYPATGSLAPGEAVPVCVQVTMSATAPASAQNAPIVPTITATAVQKGTR